MVGNILVLLLMLCLPVSGQSWIEFSGYFKNFSTLVLPPSINTGCTSQRDADLGAVNNRLRIQFKLFPLRWLSLDAAYDISPRIQDARLFKPSVLSFGIELPGFRFNDFHAQIYPGESNIPESFALFHNLDRLCLKLKLQFADIELGRQAIAWGSAHVINPTDVIAPFGFNELDSEERRGVDAIRVRIPLGMMDELDFGYVAGENFSGGKSVFFLRGKTNLLNTDVSLLLMSFRQQLLIGFDLSRSLAGASMWLETAYVSANFFKPEQPQASEYFRASLGLDYNFRNGFYVFLEYHFNSAGRARSENYLEQLGAPAFREGAVYLLGRHYLGMGVSKPISGLINASGFLLANLNDSSLIFSPQMEYNIAENIYVAAGAYLGSGKNPELGVDDGSLLLHSEFAAYPDMVFASFRIYF